MSYNKKTKKFEMQIGEAKNVPITNTFLPAPHEIKYTTMTKVYEGDFIGLLNELNKRVAKEGKPPYQACEHKEPNIDINGCYYIKPKEQS